MKKNLFICSIFLILLVSGCIKEKKKEEEKTTATVGVLIYSKDDPYIEFVTSNLKKSLEKFDFNLDIEYAQNSIEKQEAQLIKMLQQEVDILIVNLVTPDTILDFMDTIKQSDTPVIFFNREPDLAQLNKYKKVIYVGTNADEAGIMQGEIIRSLWEKSLYDKNQDGKLQYFMLRGNIDNAEATARTTNSVKYSQELGVPLIQLGETIICNWERLCAYDRINYAMLDKENLPEIIISNNDNMALGVIDSLQGFGYNKDDKTKYIPIIGVDAIPEAVAAIEKGYMAGTVKQDGVKMAETIANIVNNVLTNKDMLENTDLTYDESGIAVRIPHKIVIKKSSLKK